MVELHEYAHGKGAEPEAEAARGAYAKWGCRVVGPSHPWEEAPFCTAMAPDLPPAT